MLFVISFLLKQFKQIKNNTHKRIRMLSQQVVDSIVQDANKNIKGADRQSFLQALRDNPESVRNWAAGNMMDWLTVLCLRLGEPMFIHDPNEDAQQLVEAFQKFFQEEISKLPQASASAPATA